VRWPHVTRIGRVVVRQRERDAHAFHVAVREVRNHVRNLTGDNAGGRIAHHD
jgi:hypothetical protein